jgi:hypothetical protein
MLIKYRGGATEFSDFISSVVGRVVFSGNLGMIVYFEVLQLLLVCSFLGKYYHVYS